MKEHAKKLIISSIEYVVIYFTLTYVIDKIICPLVEHFTKKHTPINEKKDVQEEPKEADCYSCDKEKCTECA